MAGERHGIASWPGAIAVESGEYTNSHGISPGIGNLVVQPQDATPSLFGDLVIEDGVGKVTIPRCRVDCIRATTDGSGKSWHLSIQDRRWAWRETGQITGCYNQPDPHGKLIARTIRSPYELAALCLDAMGETGYEIDMPPGYTKADGQLHGQLNPDHIGLVPRAGINPPVDWQNENPANALQSLCDQLGRRVIYRVKSDSVLIAIAGKGAELPMGSIAKESPAIKAPAAPEQIAVIGSPTRYQAKFWLEAVGKEWDGSWVPIDLLSYRPLAANGRVQISKATASSTSMTPYIFQVFINAAADEGPLAGVLFETTTNNATTAVTDLAAAINASADPRIRGVVTAAIDGDTLIVTGVQEGKTFSFFARLNGGVAAPDVSFVDALFQAAVNPTGGWELSEPPGFANVRATDRLTYFEAMALAQETVFRCYRLTTTAPTGRGPLIVPGFGPIALRQQILLHDTQVEQVVPVQLNRNLVDPNRAELAIGGGNAAVNLNFYNGYSRDKPAAMYGSIATVIARNNGVAFFANNVDENTLSKQQILVPFSIDATEQIVTFSAPAYRTQNNRYYPIGSPVLLTGCNIREADNNGLRSAYLARQLPGGLPGSGTAIRKHPDIQLNLIGKYNPDGSTNGATALEADAHERAKHYLDGMQSQFIFEGGLSREYNGIVEIDCDGAISQVSWRFGGGSGASTTASRNTEHSLYVLPYPAQRRAEFLSPAARIDLAPSPRIGERLMKWVRGLFE